MVMFSYFIVFSFPYSIMKFIVWFIDDHEIIEIPLKDCQLGPLRALSEEEWEEEVGPLIQCDYEGMRYDARILQMVPDESMDTTETISVLRKTVLEKRLTSHHKLLKMCSRVRPRRRERRLPLDFISTDSDAHQSQPEEPPRKQMKVDKIMIPNLPPLITENSSFSIQSSSAAPNFSQPSPTISQSMSSSACIPQQPKLFSDRNWIAAQRYVRNCGFEWGSVEGKFHK